MYIIRYRLYDKTIKKLGDVKYIEFRSKKEAIEWLEEIRSKQQGEFYIYEKINYIIDDIY